MFPMYPEPLPRRTHDSARKRVRRRRANPTPVPAVSGLRLASLDETVSVSDALNQPLVAVVMTEDFCWQSAVADWRARRPSGCRWAQWRAWRAEKMQLDQKRARIREVAVELGLLSKR